LEIIQIYAKFSKKIINYFYGFQTSEKYISNYSQILQKLKKQNPHKEVREERLLQGVPCSRSCVRQGHRHWHDCLLDAEAERTHAQRRIARTQAPA